jgi:membrane-bound lytic murein transglycosylase C
MIKLALVFLVFFLSSCSVSDVQSVARAAISKDPSAVIKAMARDKTIQYTTNPKKLKNDIDSLDKFLSNFIKEISNIWGEKNVKIPKQKEYVKYMQNYKSRALVDFDKGIVTVETLDDKDY